MLTFKGLREANLRRLQDFKNGRGTMHTRPDGSDWIPAQWFQALVGEIGEYANIRKKFERGDMPVDMYRQLAEKELADIMMYLDMVALRCLDYPGYVHPTGVDLEGAIIDKFNEVSKRIGSEVRLEY